MVEGQTGASTEVEMVPDKFNQIPNRRPDWGNQRVRGPDGLWRGPWTPDEIANLKELLASPLYYGRDHLARLLSRTRSSLDNKMLQLRLSTRSAQRKPKSPDHDRKHGLGSPHAQRVSGPVNVHDPTQVAIDIPLAEEPPGLRPGEIPERGCKFQMNDERVHRRAFCGRLRVPGKPYCAAHQDRVSVRSKYATAPLELTSGASD